MIELNLTTSCEEHKLIKSYLEENATNILAEKINNGVRIEKDGKTLINKKDLNGFMKYASEEARKLAEKGAQYKMVHHNVVFGWAIHYFEEDSIEGTLYNEDGSEYKPVLKKTTKPSTTITKPVVSVQKAPKDQVSLFDLIENAAADKTEIKADNNDVVVEEPKPKVFTVYEKYMETQKQYPNYAIAYRLGDFYEVFGEFAKKISNKLDLTLTGRDCGLAERVPMIGFPYHVSDVYFDKILAFTPIVVVEDGKYTVKEKHKTTNIDTETGEIYDDLTEEEMREFDGDISEPEDIEEDSLEETAKNLDKELMLKLYNILGDEMTIA